MARGSTSIMSRSLSCWLDTPLMTAPRMAKPWATLVCGSSDSDHARTYTHMRERAASERKNECVRFM